MACIECQKEKNLHSLEIPLCEDCYGDMFTLKHEVADLQFYPNRDITLQTSNDNGTNTLVFSGDGDLILNGRLLVNDVDIVEGLRSFLKSAGTL